MWSELLCNESCNDIRTNFGNDKNALEFSK